MRVTIPSRTKKSFPTGYSKYCLDPRKHSPCGCDDSAPIVERAIGHPRTQCPNVIHKNDTEPSTATKHLRPGIASVACPWVRERLCVAVRRGHHPDLTLE